MNNKVSINTIKIDYFKSPTQIAFFETELEPRWIGGIGYKDEIICCECGKVIKLSDLYNEETLAIEPTPIQILGAWADISEYMF